MAKEASKGGIPAPPQQQQQQAISSTTVENATGAAGQSATATVLGSNVNANPPAKPAKCTPTLTQLTSTTDEQAKASTSALVLETEAEITREDISTTTTPPIVKSVPSFTSTAAAASLHRPQTSTSSINNSTAQGTSTMHDQVAPATPAASAPAPTSAVAAPPETPPKPTMQSTSSTASSPSGSKSTTSPSKPASASLTPAPTPSQPTYNVWEVRKKQMAEAAAAREREKAKEREAERLREQELHAQQAKERQTNATDNNTTSTSTSASQLPSTSTSLDSSAQPMQNANFLKKRKKMARKAASATDKWQNERSNKSAGNSNNQSPERVASAQSQHSQHQGGHGRRNSLDSQRRDHKSDAGPSQSSSNAPSGQVSIQSSPRQQKQALYRNQRQQPTTTAASQSDSPMQRSSSSPSVQQQQRSTPPMPDADHDNGWLQKITLLNGGQNIPTIDDKGQADVGVGIAGASRVIQAADDDEQQQQSQKSQEPAVSADAPAEPSPSWDDEPSQSDRVADTSQHVNGTVTQSGYIERWKGGGFGNSGNGDAATAGTSQSASRDSDFYRRGQRGSSRDGQRGYANGGHRGRRGDGGGGTGMRQYHYNNDTTGQASNNTYLTSPAFHSRDIDAGSEASTGRGGKSRNASPNQRYNRTHSNAMHQGQDNQDESLNQQQHQFHQQNAYPPGPLLNPLMMMGVNPTGLALPPGATYVLPVASAGNYDFAQHQQQQGTMPPPAIASSADGSVSPLRLVDPHSFHHAPQEGFSPGNQLIGLPMMAAASPQWQQGRQQGPRSPQQRRGRGYDRGGSGRGRGGGHSNYHNHHHHQNNYNKRYDRQGHYQKHHDGAEGTSHQHGQYDPSMSPPAVPSRSLSPFQGEGGGLVSSVEASYEPSPVPPTQMLPYVPLYYDGCNWVPAFAPQQGAAAQPVVYEGQPLQQPHYYHPPYGVQPVGPDANGAPGALRYGPVIPVMPTAHHNPLSASVVGYHVDPLARSTTAPTTPVSRLIGQIEFYFSDENLVRDLFLRQQMDPMTGWVPLSLIASFKRLAKLCAELQVSFETPGVKERLRVHPDVEMDMEGKRIRKRVKWEQWVIPVEGGAAAMAGHHGSPDVHHGSLPSFTFDGGSPEVMATTPIMSPPSTMHYLHGGGPPQAQGYFASLPLLQQDAASSQPGSSPPHSSPSQQQNASPSSHDANMSPRVSRNSASPGVGGGEQHGMHQQQQHHHHNHQQNHGQSQQHPAQSQQQGHVSYHHYTQQQPVPQQDPHQYPPHQHSLQQPHHQQQQHGNHHHHQQGSQPMFVGGVPGAAMSGYAAVGPSQQQQGGAANNAEHVGEQQQQHQQPQSSWSQSNKEQHQQQQHMHAVAHQGGSSQPIAYHASGPVMYAQPHGGMVIGAPPIDQRGQYGASPIFYLPQGTTAGPPPHHHHHAASGQQFFVGHGHSAGHGGVDQEVMGESTRSAPVTVTTHGPRHHRAEHPGSDGAMSSSSADGLGSFVSDGKLAAGAHPDSGNVGSSPMSVNTDYNAYHHRHGTGSNTSSPTRQRQWSTNSIQQQRYNGGYEQSQGLGGDHHRSSSSALSDVMISPGSSASPSVPHSRQSTCASSGLGKRNNAGKGGGRGGRVVSGSGEDEEEEEEGMGIVAAAGLGLSGLVGSSSSAPGSSL